MNVDLNNMIQQREEDTAYYEDAIRTIENRDKRLTRDHTLIMKDLVSQMAYIQKVASQQCGP